MSLSQKHVGDVSKRSKTFDISKYTQVRHAVEVMPSVKNDIPEDSGSSCETITSQMEFVCNECKESEEYSCLMLRNLKRHFKSKHQDLTVFKYTLPLKKHHAESGEVQVERILLLYCAECKQSSISRDKLAYHKHMSHTCFHCKRVFHCEQALEKHIKSESDFTRCDTCDKILKISGFARHRNRCSRHKRYHCSTYTSECKRIYQKKLSCSYCTERFRCTTTLQEHISAHHTKAVLYLCHICGLGFSHNGSIIHHFKVHDRNLWQCDLCSKYFTALGTLKSHINCHLGQMPFHCTICNARFIQKTNLKKHLLVHSDDRNHTCSYCGKSTKENKSLQQHIRQFHTQPQTRQCEHCNASFRWKGNLTAHLKNGICFKKAKQ